MAFLKAILYLQVLCAFVICQARSGLKVERTGEELDPPKYEDDSVLHKRGIVEGDRPDAENQVEKKSVSLHEYYPCFDHDKKTDIALRDECLFAHNKARDFHYGEGEKDLAWDDELAQAAQAHAQELADNQPEKLYHSEREDAGENVAYGAISMSSTDPIIIGGANLIYKWWKESDDWDFSTSSTKVGGGVTGHFTQMIWKSTTKVGCGLSHVTADGWDKSYLVCQYHPPGNMQGAYAENVAAPLNGNVPDLGIFDLNIIGNCDYTLMCAYYGSYCCMGDLKSICGVQCENVQC